jgi:alkylation response protein AidB-like acyl-CoA dehydrogenase
MTESSGLWPGDFYRMRDTLPADDQALLVELRAFLEARVLGGNGILLEEQVGRFVADAEAIYSYEGTREINTLIVGRALTGIGAFV